MNFLKIKDSGEGCIVPDDPFISIIVTHHNYSSMLQGALQSLQDQTYDNWECIVVDDGSDAKHAARALQIIEDLGNPKIRFHSMSENLGQIPAFFAGYDISLGEFVCALDPDDRYRPTFLEKSLAAHSNGIVACPFTCSDQRIIGNNKIILDRYLWYKQSLIDYSGGLGVLEDPGDPVIWVPFEKTGWHWTSTSSMMFRRAGLNFVRPHKKLTYKTDLDSYLASSMHLIGGTIIITEPLVDRLVHDQNVFLRSDLFSSRQDRKKDCFDDRYAEAQRDSAEALLVNRAPGIKIKELRKRFDPPIERGPSKVRHFFKKWKRSIDKKRTMFDRWLGRDVHPFLRYGHASYPRNELEKWHPDLQQSRSWQLSKSTGSGAIESNSALSASESY